MIYNIYCKSCNSQLNVRNFKAYATCMCDEDNRIVSLSNIKQFDDYNLYLFKKGTNVCEDGNVMNQPTHNP